MDILRTENLSVGYGMELVKNINISAAKGEIVSIIGPNGAGKTTLLKTICGIIDAIKGDIYIEEKNLSKISLNRRAQIIASVFTEKIYSEMLTCGEMVSLGRYPYTNSLGIAGDEDREIIKRSMEYTGIAELENVDFKKISDGQRQRVLLARAICQEPKLLVLDEPTSFLDIKYKMEFLKLLKKLSEEMGFAVVMSIHELDMVRQISDRIVCIKENQIDRTGCPQDIFSEGYIKSLYDIKDGDFDENTGLGVLWRTN